MRKQFGIFNTDAVNRQNIRIPAPELLRGAERHFKESLKCGLPLGSPSFIAHDLHRLLAWNVTSGFFLDRRVAHQLGLFLYPENATEQEQLSLACRLYVDASDRRSRELHENELRKRVGTMDGKVVHTTGGAAIAAKGLAVAVAPELFSPPATDRDGLTSYAKLLEICEQVHPGVFRHRAKNVLLYAHPYFRRSLSIRNNLNDYFLSNLAEFAKKHQNVTVRLRLDEDLVGAPESFSHPIELEYWYGPKFTSDIGRIPSGVTVHAASDREKFYEGISTTHFWWKRTEERDGDSDAPAEYRTFEAEELIEQPTPGLDLEMYGCRYVHAEYSEAAKHLTHFDGAIRAYRHEQYKERVSKNIDRSGKHSHYTKLFRFDGVIAVEDWKLLLTNFFRGNNLVPEYLGADSAPDASDVSVDVDQGRFEQSHELRAFIHYARKDTDHLDARLDLQKLVVGSVPRDSLEVPLGQTSALRTYFRSLIDPSDTCLLDYGDGIVNLPTINISTGAERQKFQTAAMALKQALDTDATAGLVNAIAVSFAWLWDDLLVKLSFSGGAADISKVLGEIERKVDPALAPSEWIEAVKEVVDAYQLAIRPEINPWACIDGRKVLKVSHPMQKATVSFPQSWGDSLTMDDNVPPAPSASPE